VPGRRRAGPLHGLPPAQLNHQKGDADRRRHFPHGISGRRLRSNRVDLHPAEPQRWRSGGRSGRRLEPGKSTAEYKPALPFYPIFTGVLNNGPHQLSEAQPRAQRRAAVRFSPGRTAGGLAVKQAAHRPQSRRFCRPGQGHHDSLPDLQGSGHPRAGGGSTPWPTAAAT
jgi:hypothetical protein